MVLIVLVLHIVIQLKTKYLQHSRRSSLRRRHFINSFNVSEILSLTVDKLKWTLNTRLKLYNHLNLPPDAVEQGYVYMIVWNLFIFFLYFTTIYLSISQKRIYPVLSNFRYFIFYIFRFMYFASIYFIVSIR